MTYFRSRQVASVVSFQCRLPGQLTLLRLSASLGLPVRVTAEDDKAIGMDHQGVRSRTGVFLDAGCPDARKRIQHVSKMMRFNVSFVWFIAAPEDDGDLEDLEVHRLAGALNLAVDSDVVLGVHHRRPGVIRAWSVHRAHPDLPLRAWPLEVPVDDVLQYPWRPWAGRRKDLTGLVVRALCVVIRGSSYGWNLFHEYLDGYLSDDDPAGILKQGPRLFDVARELYNFTFVMRAVDGGAVAVRDGVCSGMAGLLQRGEFDVGLQMPVEAAGLHCAQYVAYNLVTLNSSLVYRMPTRSSSATDSMVTPFSSASWAGVFLMFAMMALLLLVADETQLEESSGNFGPWSAALIFGTAGISWGSVHYGVNSTNLVSVEVATVIGGLSYTVMLTYYQSSVVFGLLARDSRPPLTHRELLERGYKVVADEFDFFKDVIKEILRRHLGSAAAYVNLRTGARMVRDSEVALVGDVESVAKQLRSIMTSQQLCSVRYSPIEGASSSLYSAARRGWPPAELLKQGMLLILERGLGRRIVRPFRMPCSSTDSSATQTTVSALTARAATAALVTWASGMILAATLVGLEVATPRLRAALRALLPARLADQVITRTASLATSLRSLATARRRRSTGTGSAILFRRNRKWSRVVAVRPSPAPPAGFQYFH